MIASQFADHVGARITGPGRWQAHCPAHRDRSPSLSIREGRDQRVLLHCFSGCSHSAIAIALGLKISDLFSTRPLSPQQLAQVTKQREEETQRRQDRRRSERLLEDHVRRLEAVRDQVGAKLAHKGDGSEGDALSLLFHRACDLYRAATTELEELYQKEKLRANGAIERRLQNV